MASDDSVESTIRRLLAALDSSGVPYMLTGSFASSFHGAPRTNQDIDVVIAPTFGAPSVPTSVRHPRLAR